MQLEEILQLIIAVLTWSEVLGKDTQLAKSGVKFLKNFKTL